MTSDQARRREIFKLKIFSCVKTPERPSDKIGLGIWDSGVPDVSEENDFPGSRKSKENGGYLSSG